MAITTYKDSSYSLSTLIEEIGRGEIALPRHSENFFMEAPAKVRDLFDSMYKGFLVGNFLFWAAGAEAGDGKTGDENVVEDRSEECRQAAFLLHE